MKAVSFLNIETSHSLKSMKQVYQWKFHLQVSNLEATEMKHITKKCSTFSIKTIKRVLKLNCVNHTIANYVSAMGLWRHITNKHFKLVEYIRYDLNARTGLIYKIS